MIKPRPARLLCLFNLAALGCPAWSDSDMAAGDAGTGVSSSGTLMAPEVPTTGGGGDESTPTSTTSTGTGSTGDAPGTSSSGTDTTGGAPVCGDGIVDPDEACDDGLAGNNDSRFCTADCTLNVCGDGKLFVGWELCDQGAGNSDEYGSLCGSQCEPGARCGDHKLQAEFETCDLGLDNGGVKGDGQGILCDVSCRALQLRGFVTAATFTGDLGGLFGADLKCRSAAAVAGLAEPERFHALLSTANIDVKERFKDVAVALPYVLVTGKKFADNFAALIAGGAARRGDRVHRNRSCAIWSARGDQHGSGGE